MSKFVSGRFFKVDLSNSYNTFKYLVIPQYNIIVSPGYAPHVLVGGEERLNKMGDLYKGPEVAIKESIANELALIADIQQSINRYNSNIEKEKMVIYLYHTDSINNSLRSRIEIIVRDLPEWIEKDRDFGTGGMLA